jgi:class 3 adenylate cyclase
MRSIKRRVSSQQSQLNEKLSREGKSVFGGTINMAARIAASSVPGEILVSDTVRNLARTSSKVVFENRDLHTLKGVADPQHLFTIRVPV